MNIIALVDDDTNYNALWLLLASGGHNVQRAEDEAEVGEYLTSGLSDIAIIGQSGLYENLDAAKTIRRDGQKNPVVMIDWSQTLRDKEIAEALSCGVDFIHAAPLNATILVANMQALIRRMNGLTADLVRCGDLVVDLSRKNLFVKDQPVHLTGKEWSIVERLAMSLDRTVPQDALMNHLYGGFDEPEVKIIDVFMCHIRRKIREAGGEPGHVITIPRSGYILRKEPAIASRPGEMSEKVLSFIADNPGFTRAEICKSTGIGTTNFGSLTYYLKKKGLLKTDMMSGNRRWARWSLTTNGFEWLAALNHLKEKEAA